MNSPALEAIIEVAIGMIFMWLVLSIATMSVQEWIVSRLKWRSNDLKTATRRLLGDPQWAEQLYAHPLIKGLTKKDGSLPSYIPANKFALALFDIVMTAGTHESYIQRTLHAAQAELDVAPKELGPLIRYTWKRWGDNIRDFTFKSLNYLFDTKFVTEAEKYKELIDLAYQLSLGDSELAQKQLKEFLTKLVKEQKGVDTAKFLKKYPGLESFFKKIVEGINEHQTELGLSSELKLEELVEKVNAALGQIDYENLLKQLKALAGESTSIFGKRDDQALMEQGLSALKKLNPNLYQSLNRMKNDLVGVANNTQIMENVRERFSQAVKSTEKKELQLEAMRLGAETWFNESMDRLSGWYKRKATLLAFIISLVLAGILNVDSIYMVQYLWREPEVRQALAATAEKYSVDNEKVTTAGELDPVKATEYFNKQFSSLNLPFGWKTELPADTTGWLVKVFGIILSAGAATQGAPFWFDILKKLVNVRGSGANPAESKS